ncbi:PQQ-dependent sugar dehydrogenase [Colwellia sp. E2M01]|uniref:PQQ-dependent sugar dehydrogenase n=1 Tax=Colwellia sp. E2M01 TaxID=2841561 RepID=UPI001C09662D|nr:PQQ-dependent sugar dehydrogenase [Colwellia sp. E2M01]MBU2871888.1 PQQ-dependent sugar dehydrogenase [Colwellia sp. E2M01]
MNFRQATLLVAISVFAITTTSCAQTDSITILEDKTSYKTQLLWPDIIIPWGMTQLPDGRMLATEREGKLWLLSADKTEGKTSIEITGLPEIHANGQGGLLDIALHPDFAANNLIYFTYASKAGNGSGSNTALMLAKLDTKNHKLTEQKVLYKGEENSDKGNHYGGRITFSGEHIYFSIGDRGNRDKNPQDITRDGGKIYRLNLDGSIPKDNPFYNQKSAKQAIYSYGHRNPQGLITFGDTKQIWSHEHGPQGGDEVNLIESGKNYGWPVISYGINYNGTSFTDITEKAGMEQPKLYWDPSIAPSGMTYITSDKYPQWQGKVLLGSMKFTHVVLLDIDKGKVVKQTKLLADIGGRVRSIIQGNDGYIYVGVDGKGILRVETDL